MSSQHDVFAQKTCIELSATLGRSAYADEVRCIAEHVLEVGIAFHLFDVRLFVNLGDVVDEFLIFHHAYQPRLCVHAAGGVDGTTGQRHELLVFNGAVEVFAHRAAAHDSSHHRIQLGFNSHLHIAHLVGRLEASDNTAVAANEEFREVPFDVGLLVVVGILTAQHLIHELPTFVSGVESSEALLSFQESEKR